MKLKKKRKSKRMRGKGMGTHGWGARKKHLGSGHRGGKGMAGTGKTAGHRKSQIIHLYGTEYFGRRGITSRPTKRKKENIINLSELQENLEALKKKYMKNEILNLEKYKILGDGEIKEKIVIKARAVSESAKEKIEKAGGKVIVPEVGKKENKKKEEIKAEEKIKEEA